MTLTIRIVAALVLAALIPMAVVLAVPLVSAGKRASVETGNLLEDARSKAEILVERERRLIRAAADSAAKSLAGDRGGLTAVVRGPESLARPVAAGLAERFVFDRVEILGASGAVLAAADTEETAPAGAALVERRRVRTDGETLTLVATRILSSEFVSVVTAMTSGEAHLGPPPVAECPEPRVIVPVVEGAALCVAVKPADARAVRLDLLRSFAGVAPIAFLTALSVGLVLASRIARPIRELAVRAESITQQHSRPMTLLEERDETRRMTLAFDQMLDALSASERRRLAAERVAAWEEIAKRLAHEIKNPLSPIQLAVENLTRTKERSPAAFEEAFAIETRTILEEVASLRGLVDEFAQFARLPRPHAAPADPRVIAEGALALFAGRLASMSVLVDFDATSAPGTIRADAEQLGRVLRNVIANALDAMEAAPVRKLAVWVGREGDYAVFSVTDTGRGLDEESSRRIFEPYFTTRADRGGTGLGMAIARRIAVEHGGSLEAAGSVGRGATITLKVPAAGPQEEGA